MQSRRKIFAALVYALAVLLWLVPAQVPGQSAPKAIVLAWDGTVPAFVHEMLNAGKLPNLAKLIAGGAFADDVMPGYPSFTAPGFASLWTGAPPRVTGISGNRVPRWPRNRFTILDSSTGFNPSLLRAETLWAAAERAGRKLAVVHIPSGGESSEGGVHLQGYAGVIGRDGVINGRGAKAQPAKEWENLPPSAAPPLEITIAIANSNFHGLLIDDPSDPQVGYDTLLMTGSRDGKDLRAKLKSAGPGPGGELFWSAPIEVAVSGGRNATSYLRLFELEPDGSDLLLYFTRPAREVISHPELVQGASPTIRAFVGNGASQVYSRGGFGQTIPNGGDGTAEARYLETVTLVQHQLLETNRWALEHFPWDLYLAYTPYPDEAEHLWRGYLDASLPGFRPEIARRLRPYLEKVYQTSDELLGVILAQRSDNTIVALVSDHGMEGMSRLVAINKLLQQEGLLVLDDRGRVDLSKTKVLNPAINNGYLLINTTDRKDGIVTADAREEIARRIRGLAAEIRDGDRQVVTGIYDAESYGAALGIGGESGGDIYIDLLPGYELDAKLNAAELITQREPHGAHGFNPRRPSMRTLMVLNGPGIEPGQRLIDARIIDFAPTLARLLAVAAPRDATGRVLQEALSGAR